MHRSLLELAVALVVGLSTSCSQMASPTRAKTEAVVGSKANSQPDEFAVNNSPLKLPLVNPTIVVRKTQRRLMLYSNDKLVRVYRVGLGLSPIEDKARRVIGARPKASSTSSQRMIKARSTSRWD